MRLAPVRAELRHGQRRIHTTPSRRLPVLQSTRYSPTHKADAVEHDELPSLGMLVRGGFVRQSSSGVWTLLPNGKRVADKLEKIVRTEMDALGAQEVSLPSLQPASLWQAETYEIQLFRLSDRRQVPYALAPTHEEEVTALVAGDVKSGKHLPVRLYQIGRKFRDEARPRAGLLRSKEFTMKDLYTFDATPEAAAETYRAVRKAYDRIFSAVGIPFRAVEADSGNIGGSLSHEYQYESPNGEDTVITCSSCSYAANSELAASFLPPASISSYTSLVTTAYSSAATNTLVAVILPPSVALNPIKLRRHVPDATPVSLSSGSVPLDKWDALRVLVDPTCTALDESDIHEAVEDLLSSLHGGGASAATSPLSIWPAPPTLDVVDLRTASSGELCPSCRSTLVSHRAIEVGHTFYLGTKYASLLDANFVDQSGTKRPFEMGCYGIGMSRLLAAVAECAHERGSGLRWPASVAPFSVCIIPGPRTEAVEAAMALGRGIEEAGGAGMAGDVLIDDRKETLGWRLSDAELVGYPYVVVMGKRWQETGKVEVRDLRRKMVTHATTDEVLALVLSNARGA